MEHPRMPVVLIHGALRSRAGWLPVERWLARRGFAARSFGYRTRAHTLAEHALRLDRFVQRWRDREPELWAVPERPLGILTHSMGGLVARKFIAEHATRHAERQRLVMLGPPNRGAQLARRNADWFAFRWLYGHAADELQPERAEGLGPLPSHCAGLVLAGGNGRDGYNPKIEGDDDGVVALSDTFLDGAAHEQIGGLHALLQWRPDVLERATAFLRAPPDADPR